MPQKRNPDAAELVRAKTGRIIGALHGAADGDEGPAARLSQGHAGGQGRRFDALATLDAVHRGDDRHGRATWSRDAARDEGGGRRRLLDRDRPRRLAGARRSKLPFREAHHVTGRIVAAAEQAGVPLDELPLDDHAGGRAAHHRRRSSACCRSSSSVAEPHQLRRHRAAECARAQAQQLAEAAGKKRWPGSHARDAARRDSRYARTSSCRDAVRASDAASLSRLDRDRARRPSRRGAALAASACRRCRLRHGADRSSRRRGAAARRPAAGRTSRSAAAAADRAAEARQAALSDRRRCSSSAIR